MSTKLVIIPQEFFEKMEDVFDTATNELLNEGNNFQLVHELSEEYNEYKNKAKKVEL